ncbi:low specificity L-threonine aldolase [Desulfovibrio sp. OttesenSCG-928-C06]|nr:low specificity L-threonine aldolase [Desulfovibrio sp. OttesenSCG-928-C06]
MIYFASDNNSGVHPQIMQALQDANNANTGSYGDDQWTMNMEAAFRDVFGPDTRAYGVFLGTAANVLGLKCILAPHEGIICAESAHINTDECGAMESVGRKMYLIPENSGKIDLADVQKVLTQFCNGVHNVTPKVLSITQSTEYGVLYSIDEVREISAFCRANGLYLHMDGARITNAAAALGVDLRAATRDAGVDILTFGGTKNGMMFGEAVVIFNPALGLDFPFYRKQGMQLGSKMRFLSAQFCTYLKDNLWRENALHANAMTTRLAAEIGKMPGLRITQPVNVNSVFLRIPQAALDKLAQKYKFSMWDLEPDSASPAVNGPEIRIMTSFNTTPEQVDQLAADIRASLA